VPVYRRFPAGSLKVFGALLAQPGGGGGGSGANRTLTLAAAAALSCQRSGQPPNTPRGDGHANQGSGHLQPGAENRLQRRTTYKVSLLGGRVPRDLRFRGPLEAKSFVRGPKIDPPGAPGRVFDLKCASCGIWGLNGPDRAPSPSKKAEGVALQLFGGVRRSDRLVWTPKVNEFRLVNPGCRLPEPWFMNV
jgi:hypothetical protein